MLQSDIALDAEVQSITKDEDLERESLESEEIQGLQTVPLGPRRKLMYWACQNKDRRKYSLKMFKSDKITLKVTQVLFQGFCEVSMAKGI